MYGRIFPPFSSSSAKLHSSFSPCVPLLQLLSNFLQKQSLLSHSFHGYACKASRPGNATTDPHSNFECKCAAAGTGGTEWSRKTSVMENGQKTCVHWLREPCVPKMSHWRCKQQWHCGSLNYCKTSIKSNPINISICHIVSLENAKFGGLIRKIQPKYALYITCIILGTLTYL